MGEEPGLGVVLAPVGALMLLLAVGGVLLQLTRRVPPAPLKAGSSTAQKAAKSRRRKA
jgi:hypothetical protein